VRSLREKIWQLSVSYGTACVLLIFLFLLTLLGTLEQTEHGLYEVQKKYFESWFLFHELGPISLPLPGGVLCMGLLAWNLLAGGLVRIRKSRSTAGIIVTHVGIMILLAAGLVKMSGSDDGYLRLFEGEQSDEYVSYFLWEVAVFDADSGGDVEEFIVSDEQLRLAGDGPVRISHSLIPFELELKHFLENTRPTREETPFPLAEGWRLMERELEAEAEGNLAGVYATARSSSTADQTGILWGLSEEPWVVEAGERRWGVVLRHRRLRMPFGIRLDDFTKLEHPGTDIPSEFSSDVTQLSSEGDRAVLIRMNEPLRDGGLVLFQSSWGPPDARPGEPLFSVFSVVRNPSDHWPLYSCIVIGVGLLLTFSAKLKRYVRAQSALRAPEVKS
jgi:hypothetical protein